MLMGQFALLDSTRMELSPVCFTTLMILVLSITQSEAPNPVKYELDEESIGYIGNIARDAGLSYTIDILNKLKFRFLTISASNKNYLELEPTGVLRFSAEMDREQICPGKDTCEISFDVAVSPHEYFQRIKVILVLLDKNDNAPVFSSRDYTLEIKESTRPGAMFALPHVVDQDSGVYGIQQIKVFNFGNKFSCILQGPDYRTGELFLKLDQKLDREAESEYRGKVIAYDGGSPQRSGELMVRVKLLDANDNAPEFVKSVFRASVEENVDLHTTFIHVTAIDKDIGHNGNVTYSFSDKTKQNYGKLFNIDRYTGGIYTMGEMDYESKNEYYLKVIAQDQAPNPNTADAGVVVKLKDLNDNVPQVQIIALSDTKVAQITENSNRNSLVAHLRVTDGDSGINGKVSCRMQSDNFTLEPYMENEYKIYSKMSLDREWKSSYNLSVICADEGTPVQSSRHTVKVDVLDQNDNTPKFSKDFYNFDIIEKNRSGKKVGKVEATDPDADSNGDIIYSLSSGISNLLQINPKTGVLTAKTTFNYEKQKNLFVYVTAKDRGRPPLSSTAKVTVSIKDINDNRPVFHQRKYEFDIQENKLPYSKVGQVRATDADSFLHNSISYILSSLGSKRRVFGINRKNGTIHTLMPLDREVQEKYDLIVIAKNNGFSGMSSTTEVSIKVIDVNDHAPKFSFPNRENHTIHISPLTKKGMRITRVTASDADSGVNGHIAYRFTKNISEFSVEASTGFIKVSKDLRGFVGRTFVLQIRAQDHGKFPKRAMQTLHVVVNASVHGSSEPSTSLMGGNFVIIISLSTICGIVIVVLAVAIFFTWYKRRKLWYQAETLRGRPNRSVMQQNITNESQLSDSSPFRKMNPDGAKGPPSSTPCSPIGSDTELLEPLAAESLSPQSLNSPQKTTSLRYGQEIEYHPMKWKSQQGSSVYDQYHPQPSFLKVPPPPQSRTTSFQVPPLHHMRDSTDAGSGSSVDSGHGPSEEGGGFGDGSVPTGHKTNEGRLSWNSGTGKRSTDV